MPYVYKYSIERNEWTKIVQLNIARHSHSSCLVDSTIYVICGESSDGYINSIEKLNLGAKDTLFWQLFHNSPVLAKSMTAACFLGDQ